MLQCSFVVGRGDQVVEDDAVCDLAGELHHLHAGGPDVDRHVLRAAFLVDVVQLDPVEMHVGPSYVTVSSRSRARTTVTISRMTVSGWSREMPTLRASGSHHAPSPQMIRPGAKSSSVAKVEARTAGLRVQIEATPDPSLMRSVVAPKAAMGTIASRTRRLSACQTAAKPACSA